MARKRKLKGLARRKDAAAKTTRLFADFATTKHSWKAEAYRRYNQGTFGPASAVRVLVKDGVPVEPGSSDV